VLASETAINKSVDSNYKWFILALAGLTATLVIAMPSMAMPVLFSEMSQDLGLSLVQIGAIWGTGALAGLFTGLLGGSIGDRFGAKRIISTGCLVIGITGALRGLSVDFVTLAGTVFLAGLIGAIVPMNLHKVCGVWFSGRNLGLANGVVAAGMAFGFMTGSMVSATFLSPWLGGWRSVLFFYGGVAVVMSIPWAFTRSPLDESEPAPDNRGTTSMSQALSKVARIRSVWLMGLVSLGVGGGIQGMLGYLPLYLREVGWPALRADGALASFHAMSLITVIPLALLSDRLGSRKRFLMIATVMIASGVGMLSIAEGAIVWIAVLLAGAVRDGFMAIYMTTITELDGVGSHYAGTAIGLAGTLSRVGGLVAPPVGNSLATLHLSLPFLLWAGMAIMGMVCLLFVQEGNPRALEAGHLPPASSEYV
jgi:MFS family permease